jgi:hypothetical protein
MQPTNRQLCYQHHALQVLGIARGVLRRHNRLDAVTLDGGRMAMLPDSDNHTLRIPTGTANVDVLVQAHCFLDPDRYRHAIEAAVEAAFGPALRRARGTT